VTKPDDEDWLAAGFTAEQAHGWRRWRMDPATAFAWRKAGVPDWLRAAQWSVAGVSPDTVQRWRDAGVEASEAVHWHEMGFRIDSVIELKRKGLTPDQAFAQRNATAMASTHHPTGGYALGTAVQRFHQAGVRGEIVQGYLIAHWVDEEALSWAAKGIDVADAKLWKLLRLTPVEAARLISEQRTPEELIREWWQAGIPYQEVADWLGAGLSAEEAAAQRAQGVTAEQARALRALRDDDDGSAS
jgi:hypothetical protein